MTGHRPPLPKQDFGAQFDAAVALAEKRFVAANPRSKAKYELARNYLPGGNTRYVLHYDPFPVTIVSGDGPRLTDLDRNVYLDFANDYTAGVYGHSSPTLKKAISEALENGLHLGGPNIYEDRFAAAICDRFESVDRVRFCNSGTEANLLAIQLALAVTKRSRLLVFEGGYHGSVISYVSHATGLNVRYSLIVGRYNDSQHLRDIVSEHGDDIAAIIVEPMLGSGGCITAGREFLAALREEADRCGAVLIFDEVQTARLFPGGMQRRAGVLPDLTTLGKHFGGGLAFGAFGGKADLMDHLDPSAPDAIVHGGTFNNNVLAMAAGLAGITELLTDSAIDGLNRRGGRLKQRLADVAHDHAVPLQITGFGSILGMHFQEQVLWRACDAQTPALWRKLFHLEMLLSGFYMARRGLVCLSLSTEDSHCDALVEAIGRLFAKYPLISRSLN